jgi:sulfoxide reductase catalytic subunit YedY
MLYKKNRYPPVKPSEITPEEVYYSRPKTKSTRLSRRQFLTSMAALGAGALLAAACRPATDVDELQPTSPVLAENSTTMVDDLGDPVNSYDQITNYNNYYEFTVDKERVAKLAKDFITSPWQVEVGGLVHRPTTYGLEDILKKFTQEERIYRLRCVEGWSLVIPWLGFPLAQLLKEVEPMGDAQYVRFVSIYDPKHMPGQESPYYPWPYQEGLRIDEAMNDLVLLVTGLYGKALPPQDGAPLRLAVPWKYGFKSIKAIVKIELISEQPATLWSTVAPNEYGFYSNVNPDVPHPRWSQATERRIGELYRRDTLLFNGYGDKVASLYEGMDLAANY